MSMIHVENVALYLILTVCVTISSTREHSQDLSRKESQGADLGCHQEVSGEKEEEEGDEGEEEVEEEGEEEESQR